MIHQLVKYLIVLLIFLPSVIWTNLAIGQSTPIFIKGGHYFDVDSLEMVKNNGILIRAGQFYKVGATPSKNEPQDYKILELADDEFILPGLVDVHAHYRINAFGSEKLDDIDEFKYNTRIYLANGVTSTFSNGVYYPKLELAAKRLISSGQWIGPRIYASGPYFGSARPDWENYSKEEIYQQVDYWVKQGVDGFKTKGGSPKTIKYLSNRAHQHGLTVAGHLGSGYRNSTNSITAINSGIDRIEHFLGGFVLDSTRAAYPVWSNVDTSSKQFKKTAQYFIDHHVYFNPTISTYVNFTKLKEKFDYWNWIDEGSFFTPYVQRLVEKRNQEPYELFAKVYRAELRAVKAFYDAGGGDLITMGTDVPSKGNFLAGFQAHREMHTMALAGIPEASVIKIATQNSANAIGQGTLIGSIETGKLADLFVVKGNPIEDMTNTHNVQIVIKSGVLFNPQKLLNSVKGKIGPENISEVNNWFKYDKLLKEIES